MTLLEAATYFREIAENHDYPPVTHSFAIGKYKCECGTTAYKKKELRHSETCQYAQAIKAIVEAGGKL